MLGYNYEKAYAVLFSLGLLLSAPANAQDFDKGEEALKRGDYTAALRELRPLADQGYGPAQYNLGLMHMTGQGLPRDLVRAHMWMGLAALRGHTFDQGNLPAAGLRDKLVDHMTPDQVAEAERLAREWLETHPK